MNLDTNLEAALKAVPPDLQVGVNFETNFGGTINSEIDQLMGCANLGSGLPSKVLGDQIAAGNEPATDRIQLAKLLLSGPIQPCPPLDLCFAPHVDRSTVVP